MQRALIQYRNPANYELVFEALMKEGREDLIGFDKKCLIRPRKVSGASKGANNQSASYCGKNANAKKVNDRNSQQSMGKQHKENASAKPKKKKTIRNVHKKK